MKRSDVSNEYSNTHPVDNHCGTGYHVTAPKSTFNKFLIPEYYCYMLRGKNLPTVCNIFFLKSLKKLCLKLYGLGRLLTLACDQPGYGQLPLPCVILKLYYLQGWFNAITPLSKILQWPWLEYTIRPKYSQRRHVRLAKLIARLEDSFGASFK